MLKFINYGQNIGDYGPDCPLINEPGTDNTTLLNAGYLGGVVVAIRTAQTGGIGSCVYPCDANVGDVPVGYLINGPGEFSGSIGPSGSKRISFVRAFPTISIDSQAFDTASTFTVGQPVYCGGGAKAGKVVSYASTATGGFTAPIGVVTSAPTALNPWLTLVSNL